jgi:hypothetical protein
LGYLTAGISINFFSAYVTWRFSVQIQGFAQIPIALYFFFENEKYINLETNNAQEEIETKNTFKNACTMGNGARSESFVEGVEAPFSPNIGIQKTPVHSPIKKQPDTPTKSSLKRPYINTQSLNNRASHMRRLSTRIDAVEMNDLQRYCSQTKVNFIL